MPGDPFPPLTPEGDSPDHPDWRCGPYVDPSTKDSDRIRRAAEGLAIEKAALAVQTHVRSDVESAVVNGPVNGPFIRQVDLDGGRQIKVTYEVITFYESFSELEERVRQVNEAARLISTDQFGNPAFVEGDLVPKRRQHESPYPGPR